MMKKNRMIAALAALGLIVGCQTEEIQSTDQATDSRIEIETPQARILSPIPLNKADLTNFTNSKGESYSLAIYMAEYITVDAAENMGNTVFFDDRGNKQLSGDFVPGLQFLTDNTTDVTYYIDENRPTVDLNVLSSSAAIRRAMNTWDSVTCSELGMTQIASDGRNTGLVAAALGFPGGSFGYVADVVHSGWMPKSFFDNPAVFPPGGGDFILGVAFTIVWLDGAGNTVDTDNNKKVDVAWREIYYNENFPWNIGSNFDVETIALHEAGHGLSQAHFGKLFRTEANGDFHFAPRAVMNAGYTGPQTTIDQTDNAGHCSNWSQWPMR